MSNESKPMNHNPDQPSAASGCYALQRATQHWESRERPERAIEAAIIIRADTMEDAASELEDMANRIRAGELTEGRGVGRHVTFAWCAKAHNDDLSRSGDNPGR